MYPVRIFTAEADQVVWATGRAQIQAKGVLPREEALRPSNTFYVKLNPIGDFSDSPLEFGARGLTTIFTSKAIDLVRALPMILETTVDRMSPC